MTARGSALDRAVAASVRSRGSPETLARLRQVIEWPLIERLTIISDDRDVLLRSIDGMFDRLPAALETGAAINWLHWMVATAMALAAEEAEMVAWVDLAARAGPEGTPHARRMMVFRLILLLDGHCQWRLLKCVARPRHAVWAPACHAELRRRLRAIAGRS